MAELIGVLIGVAIILICGACGTLNVLVSLVAALFGFMDDR